ncbi:MAG: MATE family efflux transporter [Dysgonomonas sp.]|nr:MATE family efflux transporter [Dysgonomonas sp.]
MSLNRLETEQPKSLLWEYSIPAIIGSMVVALYNLIDSVYIGHGPGLGDHAIGGLGIVLPVMTMFTAIGALVGTGAASRVSIYLGNGDKISAEKVLGNAFLLTLLFTCILIFFLYTFIYPILWTIGATEDTYPFAHEFLLFYLPCNIFLNLTYALCGIMRASGYPRKAMYIMLLGVIVNILLAPVFIFILQWGMKGAAIATSLSALTSLVPVIFHFIDREKSLHFEWSKFSVDSKIIWSILSIGLSPFIIQIASSIVVFIINNRLNVYGGSVAIEAYTIANRLTLIIILILVGLTQGMQPIVGYNFGAKKMKRVFSTVNYAIKVGASIGVFGLIVGVFGGDIVVRPFNPTDDLAEQSITALRIVTLMLPLSGIQMVISSFFQSVGMPVKSTLLSLSRQFLFLMPALFILPYFFGLCGVWVSIPISDFISTLLAIMLYMWQMKQLKKNYT